MRSSNCGVSVLPASCSVCAVWEVLPRDPDLLKGKGQRAQLRAEG
jgi:hypothetical protein